MKQHEKKPDRSSWSFPANSVYPGFILFALLILLLILALPQTRLHQGNPIPENFYAGEGFGTLMTRFLAYAQEETQDNSWNDAENDFPLWVLLVPLFLILPLLLAIFLYLLRGIKPGSLFRLIFLLSGSGLLLLLFLGGMNQVPRDPVPEEAALEREALSGRENREEASVSGLEERAETFFLLFLPLVLVPLALVFGLSLMRKLRSASQEKDYERLLDSVERGVVDIEKGENLRDVVLRCYHELEQAVRVNTGLQRSPALTVQEFASRLRRIGLPEAALFNLIGLFEKVRYGAQALDSADQQIALESLKILKENLGDKI